MAQQERPNSGAAGELEQIVALASVLPDTDIHTAASSGNTPIAKKWPSHLVNPFKK